MIALPEACKSMHYKYMHNFNLYSVLKRRSPKAIARKKREKEQSQQVHNETWKNMAVEKKNFDDESNGD